MRSQHWHGLGKVEKDIFGKLIFQFYVSGILASALSEGAGCVYLGVCRLELWECEFHELNF